MSDLVGAKVVVTGGTGFIGRYVVGALNRRGAEVTAVHAPGGPDPQDLQARIAVADLGVDDAIHGVVEGADLVVHLAARSGGIQVQASTASDLLASNLSMTRQVLLACERAGVSRAFLASSAVIYRTSHHPITEDAPVVRPGEPAASPYAWSKLTDEAMAAWSQVDTVVGRFANVYGSGASFDPSRSTVLHALVKKVVDAAPNGEVEVWGTGDQVRSFVYVEDAAEAVVTIVASGDAGRAYNIDGSEAVTVRELSEDIRDAVSEGIELVFDPNRPEGPTYRVLDTSAVRELQWRPRVDLSVGIARTIEAYVRGSDVRSRH